MFKEYATADGPTDIIGIDLHTVWNVQADSQYNVSRAASKKTSERLHQHGGTGLIVLRTRTGQGQVILTQARCLSLTSDTLVIVPWDQLVRYRCIEEDWDFSWFEFHITGPLPVPLAKVMAVQTCKREHERIQEACSLLRRRSALERGLASATVLALLYEWFASIPNPQVPHMHKVIIEGIIDQLHQRWRPAWTVQEMAQAAHMSVRHFRKVFEAVTGQAPKTFYQQLRLTMGRELLCQQQLSVAEVAEQLGFSSLFHFSREFKRFFGLPPSEFKQTSARLLPKDAGP